MTREAMLHLGIDAPTQNNIFQVRGKATPLRCGGGDGQPPSKGPSLNSGVSFPEDLGL